MMISVTLGLSPCDDLRELLQPGAGNHDTRRRNATFLHRLNRFHVERIERPHLVRMIVRAGKHPPYLCATNTIRRVNF